MFFFSVESVIYFYIQRNIQYRTDFELLDELDSMQKKLEANSSRLEAYSVHTSNIQMIKDFLLTGDRDKKKEIEEFFLKIIEYNTRPLFPTFDQMRVLDLNGLELIRVDLAENNKAQILMEDKMQDKSDRYYFTEYLKMDPQDVYISPMDLNVEYDKVEIPYNPVVRVIKTIFDDSGEKIGFLILNQLYESVFAEIDSITKHEGISWYIVNKDGYYLHGPEMKKSFGFMFEENKHLGFFSDFPDIWKEIQNSDERKYKYENGITFVHNFNPNMNTILKPSSKQKWYLIIDAPYESYHYQSRLLNRAIIMGSLFISPFLILIGWMLGRSIIRNRWYMKKLKKSAIQDNMTGLLNHQAALEQLDYLIKITNRMENSLCAAFLDLNDLKKINDTLGHKKGDQLLIAMSQSIKNTVRSTDIAARIGGDEYIIFFPNLSLEHSRKVMERIKKEFSERGEEIFGWKTQFSWGLSEWNKENDNADHFISRADKAMYQMKRRMKNELV